MYINQLYRFKILLLLLVLSCINLACEKLVNVDGPATSVNGDNVFASDGTASSVLTGIYTDMSSNNISGGGLTSTSLFSGLSADEFTLVDGAFNTQFISYYTNMLVNTNAECWNSVYPIILRANLAIEGLSENGDLTPSIREQLLGEAKFIRAFCFFYLVNLYGDVPLPLGTDYKFNALLARSPASTVYAQIIDDLEDAQELLSSDFLNPDILTTSAERVRPTKWAATALLARVYLFTQNWTQAEIASSSVIDNNATFQLAPINDVFLKNSIESIWQLQPVLNNPANTWEGWVFVLPEQGPDPGTYPLYLNDDLVNAFEVGDARKTTWVNYVMVNTDTFYYPFKYKMGAGTSDVVEYSTVLRLAEQYLIRAEARTQQNKLSEAETDLNAIRARSGLPVTTATDQGSLLVAINNERRLELFSEWGHRWLDLKRTGKVDDVMVTAATKKGGTWNSNWQWYPIPSYELEKDPNLTQNAGY